MLFRMIHVMLREVVLVVFVGFFVFKVDGVGLFGSRTNVFVVTEKGTNSFICEVARNPEEWRVGLMFRKSIESNRGMLFIFPRDDYYSFWMKNTYLALAIVFINNEGIVVDVFFPPPLSTKTVFPSKPCRYVLEILSNVAESICVKKGSKVFF